MPVARPWRRALCRDAARPAAERGPVLFLAFLRLAAIFRSDVIALVLYLGEFAREAAEAHLDLARIRRIRAGLYARMRFFGDASTEDLMKVAEQFARLERYERRAFSRSKHAMRLV